MCDHCNIIAREPIRGICCSCLGSRIIQFDTFLQKSANQNPGLTPHCEIGRCDKTELSLRSTCNSAGL